MRIGKDLIKNIATIEKSELEKITATSLNQCINLFVSCDFLINSKLDEIEKESPDVYFVEKYFENPINEKHKQFTVVILNIISVAYFVERHIHLLKGVLSKEDVILLNEIIDRCKELGIALKVEVRDIDNNKCS